MNILLTQIGKAIFIVALLVIIGCAEIQPISPPNHREEGPEKGLFTGSRGAWEITLPEASQAGGEEDKNAATDTETERKEKKSPDESADGTQQ
jgi:hypothetical protein